MSQLFQQKFVLRVAALSVMTLCLIIIWREDSNAGLGKTSILPTQSPVIMVQNQPGAPLVISAARQLPADGAGPEIAFNLTNVFPKTIRAFAIKQDVERGSSKESTVFLYNLDLSDSDLQPNQSRSDFSTYEVLSEEQHRVTLTVEYVQFSDGKSWGVDSAKSAERIAGQRAAGQILTDRLIKAQDAASINELLSATEAGGVNIEPPEGHSEEWNQGFQLATTGIARRLKRALEKGGLHKVNSELNQLARRFKGDR